MSYYFGLESKSELVFFGPIHLSLLISTILIIFLIYKYKDRLKKIKYLEKISAIILLLNMIIYFTGGILSKEFNINFHIPIQYCYITGFIYMYMIFFKKEKLYNFLYYAIIFCTTTVMIFQDPTVSYDRYHLILLIISHHFLLISSFYTFYVLEYPVNKKGIIEFIIYSIILYSIVYIINLILNTTYIYKESFPDFIYEYLTFLNKMPTLFWFAVYMIPTMFVAYYLVKLRNKKKLS